MQSTSLQTSMANSFITIDSPEGNAFLESLRQHGGMAVLLGSGISIWEPSNLPTGQQITDELAAIIASSTVSPQRTVLDLIKRSAFEHIMERYPRREILPRIIARTFHPTVPNPVHHSFARLLDAGIIQHIITTNYDVGLETACLELCTARVPNVIVSESDAQSVAASSEPVIFKVHGSASPGQEQSMVVTLGEEGEMPQWKRALLEFLINGKPLLVCGYSGLDFEICPELTQMKPTITAWNSYHDPRRDEDAMSSNAKRVLSATGGTVLIGDMKTMLALLGQTKCQAESPMVSPSFVKDLVDNLDAWELDKWRVWVLNGLSCGLDGIEIARSLYRRSGASRIRRLDSLLALAEPLFHCGLYKQAALAYSEAALLAPNASDLDQRMKAEVGIAVSDLGAGYWLRAWWRIRTLPSLLSQALSSEQRDRISAAIALTRVLARRYLFELAKTLHLPFICRTIRSKITRDLSLVATYSAQKASWFDLQHCEMLARRLGIPFHDVYSGPMMPLTAREGFRHLGYLLAEIMGYRDVLSDKNEKNPPLDYLYIILADEIGCNPEVWKLTSAITKRFGRNALPWAVKQRSKRAWQTCEYTLWMRLFRRFRRQYP